MTLLTRITEITALKHAMANGIVCLTDTNEQGHICHAYVTTNEDLIDFFGGRKYDIDDIEDFSHFETDNAVVTFDILEDEEINLLPHIYTGYAHAIAQLTEPETPPQSTLLALNLAMFVNGDGFRASLISVLDSSEEYNLVFCIYQHDEQEIVQVNEFGIDRNDHKLIFNANSTTPKWIEREGYLLISKTHNPVFVSKAEKDSVQLTDNSKLLSAIGYLDSQEHLQAIVLLANSL